MADKTRTGAKPTPETEAGQVNAGKTKAGEDQFDWSRADAMTDAEITPHERRQSGSRWVAF